MLRPQDLNIRDPEGVIRVRPRQRPAPDAVLLLNRHQLPHIRCCAAPAGAILGRCVKPRGGR